MLLDLARSEQAAPMNPTQIEQYLDRQTERYRTRGWWRGTTPLETAAEQQRARERAPVPPGGRREQTRDEQRADEERRRSARRRGSEAVAPRGTRTRGAPTGPVTMTPQAEQFYSGNGRAIGEYVDSLMGEMYGDRRRGTGQERDGDILTRR